jgi:putative oxidoreductase
MASNEEKIPLIVPSLGGVYEKLMPYMYPLLRAMMGLIFIPHGMQKLFGVFGAFPMQGYVGFFGKFLGPTFGTSGWVYYIGCLEFFGGIALVIGLLTRFVAVQFVAFMAIAALFVNSEVGWFWTKGGTEVSLSWGVVCLFILIMGAGPMSVDRKIGKEF